MPVERIETSLLSRVRYCACPGCLIKLPQTKQDHGAEWPELINITYIKVSQLPRYLIRLSPPLSIYIVSQPDRQTWLAGCWGNHWISVKEICTWILTPCFFFFFFLRENSAFVKPIFTDLQWAQTFTEQHTSLCWFHKNKIKRWKSCRGSMCPCLFRSEIYC